MNGFSDALVSVFSVFIISVNSHFPDSSSVAQLIGRIAQRVTNNDDDDDD